MKATLRDGSNMGLSHEDNRTKMHFYPESSDLRRGLLTADSLAFSEDELLFGISCDESDSESPLREHRAKQTFTQGEQQAETPTFPDCGCSASFPPPPLPLRLLFFTQESFFLCAPLPLSPTSLEVRLCDFESFCKWFFLAFFRSGSSAETLQRWKKGVKQQRQQNSRPQRFSRV